MGTKSTKFRHGQPLLNVKRLCQLALTARGSTEPDLWRYQILSEMARRLLLADDPFKLPNALYQQTLPCTDCQVFVATQCP
jgi:hypothetical protein